MKIRILYTLIAWILTWIASFILKISATNNFNKSRIMFFWNFIFLLISSIHLLLDYQYVHISTIIFILIAVRIIAAYEKNLFIMKSLQYIESSIFFPVQKIIHLLISFIIWMLLFHEYLWTIEIISILLWMIMIILLSDKKNRKIQVDYKKWIIFLLASNFALLFSSTINKYISSIGLHIPTYIFLSSIIWGIYLMITKKDIYEKVTPNIINRELFYGSIRWVVLYFWFIFLILALQKWPLVLVWMSHSISIFVPIILSIIIYGEKINIKKIIAFLLFIIIMFLLSLS